jgi:hypothetical protein
VLALALACQSPGTTEDSSTSSDTNPTSSESGVADLGTDELPPVPTLQSPADGATNVPLATELCWNLVDDPDGEPVRYRVTIDDTSLTEGRLGDDDGYAGPCVGPLLFAYERTYTWQVEAFEVDDPSRSSGPSAAWSFSTVGDGLSETVFLDDFEDELGWQITGDAFAGAWVRGDPIAADDGDQSSQPGACAGGTSCYFTGQNPNGLADDEDVAGGETILTSPEFDLGGAAAATVRLERFFYKSDPMPGPLLAIELLTPNDAAPEGYDVHPLELLEAGSIDAPANAWLPREYAACGPPMLDGSRLRIRASDPGTAILEAAIDSVSVHAHDDPSFCEPGEGGLCDPTVGPDACPGELLCCSQGAVNLGVYRCETPVAGLDYDNPPANPTDPGNGALGCDAPDLIVDPTFLAPLFADIFMTDTTCEVLEGCVGGLGWRRVMLFTTATPNIGSRDLALGVAANLPELFHYSECHDHYHFDEFARYQLRDGDSVIATGHKQAFCLLDTTSWAWPLALGQFDCANQGVSRGFSDFYESGLPCQWVDITDTPPGQYTLRISLNQPRPGHAIPALNERDYTNNVIDVPVVIP